MMVDGRRYVRRVSNAPLGITGSTGRLGGRVARRLADAGVPMRLLVRDPNRAPDLPDVTVARAGYADGDAVRQGLEGVTTVLMVSAAEAIDRVDQHRAFVDAAVAAGVEHVVYTSFYNAAPDATFTLARHHWATEEHLRASGVSWTFLRDNLYADVLPLLAGEDGVLRGPAGDGRAAFVAIDDVADVAVTVLREPAGHAGRTYDLTGPGSLTLEEAARIATEVTGREMRYEPETIEEAFASRVQYDAPDWMVEGWVSTYTAIANGELDGVTDDVEHLTGRAPRPLAEVLQSAS